MQGLTDEQLRYKNLTVLTMKKPVMLTHASTLETSVSIYKIIMLFLNAYS